MNRLALLAAAISLARPWPAAAGERLRAGLWEVTATVELPGAGSPAPTKQTECLSQEDVEADRVPEIAQGVCRVTDARRSGDKVTWKLDCGSLGKGEGEIVYRSPTSYDGWMKLETAGAVVRTTIQARRLRDC
ncbi:MAG TPA: DUF3617 family protein [Anaeromyxobacter sp.]|nr:DUF3617 family protein [Anaeromyxobacter sp.]